MMHSLRWVFPLVGGTALLALAEYGDLGQTEHVRKLWLLVIVQEIQMCVVVCLLYR
jgi:hypothetical protein